MDFDRTHLFDLESFITDPKHSVRERLTALAAYRERNNSRDTFLFSLVQGAEEDDAFARVALGAFCMMAVKRGGWKELMDIVLSYDNGLWVKQEIAHLIVTRAEPVPYRWLGAIIDNRDSEWFLGDRGHEFAFAASEKIRRQWAADAVH